MGLTDRPSIRGDENRPLGMAEIKGVRGWSPGPCDNGDGGGP